MTRLTLRDYQHDAIARIHAAEARGVRRQLGVAATGLGKTVIFCSLAEQRGGRTLVLAHRDELIEQAAAKVREVWPAAHVGVVKAERNEVDARVVVASVQTLARQRRLDHLVSSTAQDNVLGAAEPFDLVVVDEAHHTAADTYRRILDGLAAGAPDGPLLLGVTATPDRGDGKGLDDLFEEITFTYDILWGIGEGYLSDLRGLRVTVDFDLGKVKVKAGDYDQGQAGRMMEAAGAPGHIVDAWRRHAAGRRTLCFTPTVALAEQVAEAFRHAGINAAWVAGSTPLDERRATLAAYSRGDIDVLANCAVLTEGYDEPRTDCIIVARPTRSRALYVQMVGRGTRRHPDKTDCLVLDVVGATAEHNLVTIPSLFGLDDASRQRMEREGQTAAAALEQQQEIEVRAGRLRAEAAELFHRVRRDGLAWIPVHDRGQPAKYVIALGRDEATVVLFQRDDQWRSGLRLPDGSRRLLIADVSMEMAQGVAEDWIRKMAPRYARLADTNAEWRKRRPSDKQVAAATRFGIKVDPKMTAGELSDLMGARIERLKARRAAR